MCSNSAQNIPRCKIFATIFKVFEGSIQLFCNSKAKLHTSHLIVTKKPLTTIMLDFTASVLLALLISQIAYPQGLVHLVAWLAIFFSYYFFAVSMAGALRVNQVVFTGTETKILRITFLIPCFDVYYIFYQGVGGLITSVFLPHSDTHCDSNILPETIFFMGL